MEVDVVTSPAVNAKAVRARMGDGQTPEAERKVEESIDGIMRERMARVLCLFQVKGLRNLVLGSFGTGAFGCVLSSH